MARKFETITSERPNHLLAMKLMQVRHIQDGYARNKTGIAVNDGKYLTYVDDREVN